MIEYVGGGTMTNSSSGLATTLQSAVTETGDKGGGESWP